MKIKRKGAPWRNQVWRVWNQKIQIFDFEPSPIEELIPEHGVDLGMETPIEIEENQLVVPTKEF